MSPVERIARPIEVPGHSRRGDQLPVETVGPAVVGADEPLCGTAMFLADPGAAMPTDVEERVDRAVRASRDENALGTDVPCDEVTRIPNL